MMPIDTGPQKTDPGATESAGIGADTPFEIPLKYFPPAFVDDSAKQRFESRLGQFLNVCAPLNKAGSVAVFADNLLTIGRAFSFLEDRRFTDTLQACAREERDLVIAWRTHVLTWAAKSCLALEGDFVECGTYRAYSAEVICGYVEPHRHGKRFVVYDLFDPDEAAGVGHRLPSHGDTLFAEVADRLAPYPGTLVVRGKVPDALPETAPEKICFMHLDMNNAEAEAGALAFLFDRIVDGGMVVLDDYGWAYYSEQRVRADRFAAEHGQFIVELPTGQGLFIKRAAAAR
ncbi:TylF/MycF/NovP-related O-methyltransferase [Marinibaculum pumilum]|uniref:TylF/MycF/NovP-related O-methyltransferase n=1 Tax=Marinibaculum pumilum TaxID=1766165 RepID=A0ABV7L654_9PROT